MNKIVKIMLVVALVALGLFFAGALIMRFDTGGGLHTYRAFGDGRFDVWVGGQGDLNRSLHDNEIIGISTLVASVERYLERGDLLYVTGYHSFTGANPNNPHPPYHGFRTDSHDIDDAYQYNSVEEIPRYIILNTKTAEMQLYRTLDEVPTDQQPYFTQKLNWWCDLMRTCYEVK